jgi:hypothetical protein
MKLYLLNCQKIVLYEIIGKYSKAVSEIIVQVMKMPLYEMIGKVGKRCLYDEKKSKSICIKKAKLSQQAIIVMMFGNNSQNASIQL